MRILSIKRVPRWKFWKIDQWEVEKWKPVPPRDPILVKRLTPNLFGVLATWNLTELERAIIRGRIQT